MSATAEFTTASTSEELPSKRRLSPRTFASAMQVRSYRWWFGSQVLSASGTMMQAVAISWLVLKLSSSALLLSLTTSVMFLPLLVGGAWAGSLVDRMEPRRLLLLTQSVFLVLTTTFAVLVATTSVPVWVVFVFAFANGLVSTFDMPARQVFVLDLVGREHAANAVSLNEVVLNTSRILGPAVGGALLATVGVAICLFVNAFTFIPTIGVLLALIWRRGWSSKRETTSQPRQGHVREGLAYVWRMPAIRSCVLMAVAGGMLFNMGVTLPLLATRAFHAGPEGYGAMMATFGVGALFGAGLAAMGAPWPSGRKGARPCRLYRRRSVPGGRVSLDRVAVRRPGSRWFVVYLVHLVGERPCPVAHSPPSSGPSNGSVDHGPSGHGSPDQPADRRGSSVCCRRRRSTRGVWTGRSGNAD